jgi:signal transduction histidine kinase
VDAIEWQAQQFQARTGIECRFESSVESIDLSPEQSTAVFRIAQEALTNVLRHAQATRVEIAIEQTDGKVIVTIADNGKGIPSGQEKLPASLGLLGMQERARLAGGTVEVANGEDSGTVVTVWIPA